MTAADELRPDAPLPGALVSWLTEVALPGRTVRRVSRLAGGYVNDNVRVELAADVGSAAVEAYVVRRYLRHNTCAVEAALAELVSDAVPVPEVVAADPSGTAAGEPVLVSRFAGGRPVAELLPELPASEAGELGRAVGEVLASIGEFELARPGFFSGPDLTPGPPGMEPTAELPAFVEHRLRTGNAHLALTATERDGVRRLAQRYEPLLAPVRGSRRLVHADYNPKNLLAERAGDSWTVTAVLDWEFAFSSSPLVDVGNMLRFEDELGPAYAAGFVAGYASRAELPEHWREICRHSTCSRSPSSSLVHPSTSSSRRASHCCGNWSPPATASGEATAPVPSAALGHRDSGRFYP